MLAFLLILCSITLLAAAAIIGKLQQVFCLNKYILLVVMKQSIMMI
jgi:hypothetical protein